MNGRDGRALVTGVGLVTPIGNDPAAFWRSLLSGRSGASQVRSFDTEHLPNHVGLNGCSALSDDAVLMASRMRGR